MTHLKVVTGPVATTDPNTTTSATISCPWQAAVAAAIADSAVRGVILYEAENGHAGRRPINAGRATIRGLCIETIDDLDTQE
jgi:hypothetical protein